MHTKSLRFHEKVKNNMVRPNDFIELKRKNDEEKKPMRKCTFSLSSSKYSFASSLRCNLISVPLPSGSFQVSSEIANEPSALDSHTYLKDPEYSPQIQETDGFRA